MPAEPMRSKRGPTPNPTAKLDLQGTQASELAPPADLTDEQRAIWFDVAPRCTTPEPCKLRRYVEAAATAQACQRVIDMDGIGYETNTGNYRKRPEADHLRGLLPQILRLEIELGLGSMSQRSSGVEGPSTDPLTEFVNG